MSDVKHTPGPWEYRRPGQVYAKDGTFISLPSARKNTIGAMQFSECMANAHLIAAAPDLLVACEAILKDDAEYMADDGEMYPEYLAERLDQIRAAIAKAKGE